MRYPTSHWTLGCVYLQSLPSCTNAACICICSRVERARNLGRTGAEDRDFSNYMATISIHGACLEVLFRIWDLPPATRALGPRRAHQ